MMRRKRNLLLVTAVTTVLALMGNSAASAGTAEIRTASVHPSASVYEWITHNLYADPGDDIILAPSNLDPWVTLRARWVKCGYTSTQDAASSVGGNAVRVWNGGRFTLGTDFRGGSCVRIWARVEQNQPARVYFTAFGFFAEG